MRTRRGFTMMELLIVIGILVVLAAMVSIGVSKLSDSARERNTRVTLENAKGLLAEYETAAKSTPTYGAAVPVPAPGLVTSDNASPSAADGRLGDAVKATRKVMMSLLAVPNNKRAVGQLPAEQLFVFGGAPLPTPEEQATPVLLDGWGNPLIYVPKEGLVSVEVNGVVLPDPVKAPNSRPFWASAGADGRFDKGDDNVYSFEN